MKEPIKAGDECIVVSGALGAERCLNRGRHVIVMHLSDGRELLVHNGKSLENHGVVWRVRTKDGKPLRRLDGDELKTPVPADQCDCARTWLQKADPLPPQTTTTNRELEHS